MLADGQKVRPKSKKDSFSEKSHPSAATVTFVDCCPAIHRLADRACRIREHQMRMTDGDSCRIGGIVGPGSCWQVKQLAYHKAYLFFASSSIPRHRQLHRAWSVLSDRHSPLLQ